MSDKLLGSLDYLYVAAPDIGASLRFYQDGLGGELRWRIRHGNTWVAAIRFAPTGPLLLLANHLEPGRLLLIYQTTSLRDFQQRMASAGWSVDGEPFDIPAGPCVIVRDPAGQRLAVYQRLRPEVDAAFEGRFDHNENVTEP